MLTSWRNQMQNEAAGPGAGFIYMQTNELERNRVLAFRRADDGTLTPAGAYETGGGGGGQPPPTPPGAVGLTRRKRGPPPPKTPQGGPGHLPPRPGGAAPGGAGGPRPP